MGTISVSTEPSEDCTNHACDCHVDGHQIEHVGLWDCAGCSCSHSVLPKLPEAKPYMPQEIGDLEGLLAGLASDHPIRRLIATCNTLFARTCPPSHDELAEQVQSERKMRRNAENLLAREVTQVNILAQNVRAGTEMMEQQTQTMDRMRLRITELEETVKNLNEEQPRLERWFSGQYQVLAEASMKALLSVFATNLQEDRMHAEAYRQILRSELGEAVHAALRKGCEGGASAWEAINSLDPQTWSDAMAWAAECLIDGADGLAARMEIKQASEMPAAEQA